MAVYSRFRACKPRRCASVALIGRPVVAEQPPGTAGRNASLNIPFVTLSSDDGWRRTRSFIPAGEAQFMHFTRLSTRHILLKSGRPAQDSQASRLQSQSLLPCRPPLCSIASCRYSRTETILENHNPHRTQSGDRHMDARTFPFLGTPKPPGT